MHDHSKLRPYDLTKAKVGDKVLTLFQESRGEVIAVSSKEIVFGWADDIFTIFKNGDYPHHLLQMPLAWLGPDPVYAGDTLWQTAKSYQGVGKSYTPDHADGSYLVCNELGNPRILLNNGELAYPTHWSLTKPEPEPRFIEINGHKVPEPLRNAPEKGTQYYVFDLHQENMIDVYSWADDVTDRRWLERGLIHATQEAAYAHAEALLSFTEVNHKEY